MRVVLYKLSRSSPGKVLPKLLEKLYAQEKRVVVLADNAEHVEHVVYTLWTYSPGSFLPHGSAEDGRAADQPIWVTGTLENPNGADVLVILGGREVSDIVGFSEIMVLINAEDAEGMSAARKLWEGCGSMGSLWAQSADGWQKISPESFFV